jgi:hypothetical protein
VASTATTETRKGQKMQKIIAIDQSYTCTGLAVMLEERFIDWCSLSFGKGLSRSKKREKLTLWLNSYIIGGVATLIVLEQSWTLPGTSISIPIIDLARDQKVDCKSINPRSWKKKLLGDANAPKSASIKFASELIGRDLADDNIADAVCIAHAAYCYPGMLKRPE